MGKVQGPDGQSLLMFSPLVQSSVPSDSAVGALVSGKTHPAPRHRRWAG